MNDPIMLHNPTNEAFECFSGGALYIFQPKQSRILEWDTAQQILKNQNTPLIQVEVKAQLPEEVAEKPTIEKVEKSEAVDYSSMTYAQLRTVASQKGIFKVGMKTKDLLELLNGQ